MGNLRDLKLGPQTRKTTTQTRKKSDQSECLQNSDPKNITFSLRVYCGLLQDVLFVVRRHNVIGRICRERKKTLARGDTFLQGPIRRGEVGGGGKKRVSFDG